MTLRLAQCFGLAAAMRFRLREGHVGIDNAERQIVDQKRVLLRCQAMGYIVRRHEKMSVLSPLFYGEGN